MNSNGYLNRDRGSIDRVYSLLDPDVGDTLVRIDHSPVDFLFYVYHIV
jgi:hypothetical protein